MLKLPKWLPGDLLTHKTGVCPTLPRTLWTGSLPGEWLQWGNKILATVVQLMQPSVWWRAVYGLLQGSFLHLSQSSNSWTATMTRLEARTLLQKERIIGKIGNWIQILVLFLEAFPQKVGFGIASHFYHCKHPKDTQKSPVSLEKFPNSNVW